MKLTEVYDVILQILHSIITCQEPSLRSIDIGVYLEPCVFRLYSHL